MIVLAGSRVRQMRARGLAARTLAARTLAAVVALGWRAHALDRRIAPRAAQGDATGGGVAARQIAFERLVARYQAPLLDFLYGMTRDREWAADLVQETFLKAYSAAPDPDAIAYPQAWLYRIATNAAINALRHRNRFAWLPLARLEPDAGADSSDRWRLPPLASLPYEDVAASVAERDAVWSVLAELPPRWRAVLLLQTTAGFSTAEIADQLGLTEANVRKLLFRAKERYRAIHARLEALGEAKGGAR